MPSWDYALPTQLTNIHQLLRYVFNKHIPFYSHTLSELTGWIERYLKHKLSNIHFFLLCCEILKQFYTHHPSYIKNKLSTAFSVQTKFINFNLAMKILIKT